MPSECVSKTQKKKKKFSSGTNAMRGGRWRKNTFIQRNEKKKQKESDFRRVQEINEMRDNLSFQKAVKGFHGYNNTLFVG